MSLATISPCSTSSFWRELTQKREHRQAQLLFLTSHLRKMEKQNQENSMTSQFCSAGHSSHCKAEVMELVPPAGSGCRSSCTAPRAGRAGTHLWHRAAPAFPVGWVGQAGKTAPLLSPWQTLLAPPWLAAVTALCKSELMTKGQRAESHALFVATATPSPARNRRC